MAVNREFSAKILKDILQETGMKEQKAALVQVLGFILRGNGTTLNKGTPHNIKDKECPLNTSPHLSSLSNQAYPLSAGDEQADDEHGEDDAAGDARRDDHQRRGRRRDKHRAGLGLGPSHGLRVGHS